MLLGTFYNTEHKYSKLDGFFKSVKSKNIQ